jgi:RNA exonuclease 4
MPGLDLSAVSSNWKRLQEKLKAENAEATGVKRKRVEARKPATAFKKTKLSATSFHDQRKRKMGAGESKPVDDRSRLVKEHGIAAQDVSAAYGGNVGSITRKDDEINGGLHPTHKAGKYVALDCEMVGTGPPPYMDNILARVSLVNFHGEQIYDSYVLPPTGDLKEIKDYRTHVSGIKEHHLRPGYARPFAEVQKDVAKLLDGRILVGHALRNDLNVLLLSHPKRDMRDTSRHPKYRVESRGKPPALRNLVKSELGLSIQTGEHSSIEDARAAMMLYKRDKTGFEEENRMHFGMPRKVEKRAEAFRAPTKARVEESEGQGQEDDDVDEDEFDLLDGEEEEDVDEDEVGMGKKAKSSAASGSMAKKKKRKKKKRTKRH